MHVQRLPAGYVKEQFAEDIEQELFCNCIRLFANRKNGKYPLSTRVHNYVKNAAYSFWRSYQKIYEHEVFGDMPPSPRQIWAENAAIPLNFIVETWFDLQCYARKNLNEKEKTLLCRKFTLQKLFDTSPPDGESIKVLHKLYRKLRSGFLRKEY